MTKPLLIVCVLLSLGAAVLGYINFQKLEETRQQYVDENALRVETEGKLKVANDDIEAKKKEITALNAEKDKLTSDLEAKKQELDKTKDDLKTAQGQLESATKDLEQSKADLTAAQEEIARLQKENEELKTGGPKTVTPEGGGEDPRVKELETLNKALQDRNTALESRVAVLQTKQTNIEHAQMQQGLQGQVLAVNSAWNFVVLSIGDRQGVVPNAEMLVKRGEQLLGRVRVTSVEPGTSVADIIVKTVPRGYSVMPGDTVIYQSNR